MFENVLFEVKSSTAGDVCSRSFATLPPPCLVYVPRVLHGFARTDLPEPGVGLAGWRADVMRGTAGSMRIKVFLELI